MLGIKDGAYGKRTIEIRLVGAAQRQAADEHSSGIARIEIVGIGCRYGDNIGGARGASNVDLGSRWIGQVHRGKKARSAGSDISQTRSGLKCHLWVCSRIQGNVTDGTVRQRPTGGRRTRETPEFCRDIRVGIQVQDQADVRGSKRDDRAMRKGIDADGVRERLRNRLAGGIGLRNYAAQIHGPKRRTGGNRKNGKRPTRVIHNGSNIGLGWSLENELLVHSHASRDITAGRNLIGHRRYSTGQIDELDVIGTHASQGDNGQVIYVIKSYAAGGRRRPK